MRRLESYEENKAVRWARRRGVLTTKLKIAGQNGWPDRAFWLPGGQVMMVEFKRKGERPRKLQRHVMERLKDLGFAVFWTDDADEAIRYLEARCA